MLGKEVDGLVACDQFQPTVLEGQRCYSMDLGKEDVGKSKSGIKNGLLLILDVQEENLEANTEAKIYLHTLTPFTALGNGSNAMFSLKKMTGTKSFLGLPDGTKKCQVQSFESCNTREYLKNVHQTCNCLLCLAGRDWDRRWWCATTRQL